MTQARERQAFHVKHPEYGHIDATRSNDYDRGQATFTFEAPYIHGVMVVELDSPGAEYLIKRPGCAYDCGTIKFDVSQLRIHNSDLSGKTLRLNLETPKVNGKYQMYGYRADEIGEATFFKLHMLCVIAVQHWMRHPGQSRALAASAAARTLRVRAVWAHREVQDAQEKMSQHQNREARALTMIDDAWALASEFATVALEEQNRNTETCHATDI